MRHGFAYAAEVAGEGIQAARREAPAMSSGPPRSNADWLSQKACAQVKACVEAADIRAILCVDNAPTTASEVVTLAAARGIHLSETAALAWMKTIKADTVAYTALIKSGISGVQSQLRRVVDAPVAPLEDDGAAAEAAAKAGAGPGVQRPLLSDAIVNELDVPPAPDHLELHAVEPDAAPDAAQLAGAAAAVSPVLLAGGLPLADHLIGVGNAAAVVAPPPPQPAALAPPAGPAPPAADAAGGLRPPPTEARREQTRRAMKKRRRNGATVEADARKKKAKRAAQAAQSQRGARGAARGGG